jgi:hypothetical protein
MTSVRLPRCSWPSCGRAVSPREAWEEARNATGEQQRVHPRLSAPVNGGARRQYASADVNSDCRPAKLNRHAECGPIPRVSRVSPAMVRRARARRGEVCVRCGVKNAGETPCARCASRNALLMINMQSNASTEGRRLQLGQGRHEVCPQALNDSRQTH